MNQDILPRLQIDPGTRTLGQLLQDREAALQEIQRLRREIERLRKFDTKTANPILPSHPTAYREGTLMNIKQVSELIGLSRSTIYKRVAEGTFPHPLRIGARSVRWMIDDISTWRDSLQ